MNRIFVKNDLVRFKNHDGIRMTGFVFGDAKIENHFLVRAQYEVTVYIVSVDNIVPVITGSIINEMVET